MIKEKKRQRADGVSMKVAIAVAWLLFGDPALAQPTPDEPRSIADSMIEISGAEGVFEYVHDGHTTLRHVQSGLVCRFMLGGVEGRLVIFSGLPRGEDVGCDQTDGRETLTLYATRYPEQHSLAWLMSDARAALEQRFPSAHPYPPEATTQARPNDFDAPEGDHARYLITDAAGERLYSRVSLAIIDGWALKLRYSVIAPDEASLDRAEIEANAHWAMAFQEFMLSRAS